LLTFLQFGNERDAAQRASFFALRTTLRDGSDALAGPPILPCGRKNGPRSAYFPCLGGSRRGTRLASSLLVGCAKDGLAGFLLALGIVASGGCSAGAEGDPPPPLVAPPDELDQTPQQERRGEADDEGEEDDVGASRPFEDEVVRRGTEHRQHRLGDDQPTEAQQLEELASAPAGG